MAEAPSESVDAVLAAIADEITERFDVAFSWDTAKNEESAKRMFDRIAKGAQTLASSSLGDYSGKNTSDKRPLSSEDKAGNPITVRGTQPSPNSAASGRAAGGSRSWPQSDV